MKKPFPTLTGTRWWRLALAPAVAALVLLSGCTASPTAPDTTDATTPAATEGEAAGAGEAAAEETAEPAPAGVAASEATLVRSGDDATLIATFTNEGVQAVTLRAVACPCAGMVQLGTPAGDELTPLSTGLEVPAGGSAEIGNDQVVVRLTGVTEAVTAGQEVALQAYFGTEGVVEFTAGVEVE
ncbi:copper chaperone PCu(A)C [Propioniciclava soli]|uniref:copper chaperone PCu(A)C n=1 Tax=Propioniciclava soli TaxID=2775081 RepID=UPI001E55BCCC